jgi:hypothetical protein
LSRQHVAKQAPTSVPEHGEDGVIEESSGLRLELSTGDLGVGGGCSVLSTQHVAEQALTFRVRKISNFEPYTLSSLQKHPNYEPWRLRWKRWPDTVTFASLTALE